MVGDAAGIQRHGFLAGIEIVNKRAVVGLLITLSLGATTFAAEYNGTVKSVSGDSILVAMDGDVMPPNGAKAEIFFKLAGTDDEVSVASGTALQIDHGDMRVKIDNASGSVSPGQLVRFFPVANGGNSAQPAPSAAVPPSPVAQEPDLAAIVGSPPPVDEKSSPADEKSPDAGADQYLKRARDKISAGDKNGALAILNEGIQAAPSGQLYLARAQVNLAKRNSRSAIADANEALELKVAKSADAYMTRAVGKGDLNQFQSAIADLDRVLKVNPRYAEALSNRANYKIQIRDYHGAVADCNQGLTIKPKMPNLYCNRGYAYWNLGKLSRALADLERTVQLDRSFASQLNPQIAKLKAAGVQPSEKPPGHKAKGKGKGRQKQ